ncbi:MAG TPA: hypothetical protein PK095_14640, partial [Myxococcota bacterium]|nr:hypothetical protein [Myxococcota bacterium]
CVTTSGQAFVNWRRSLEEQGQAGLGGRAASWLACVLLFGCALVWCGACGRSRDGGHLVVGLGMSQAEVLAASVELGEGFEEVRLEGYGDENRRATADRVTLKDLVVGQHLEFPRSLVGYSLQGGRVCRVDVTPLGEAGCPLERAMVGRVLTRAGFLPASPDGFEGELRDAERRWRETRAADPEFQQGGFDVVLERSDARAFVSVLPG